MASCFLMVKLSKMDGLYLCDLLILRKQSRKFLKTIAKIAEMWYDNCIEKVQYCIERKCNCIN